MSDFEIRRVTEEGGPQMVSIFYKGVDISPDRNIPAFGGEAEALLPLLERVAQVATGKHLFLAGDRVKLKDVDIILNPTVSKGNRDVWVARGTEGTIMRVTWTSNKEGNTLRIEVDFDHGKFKQFNKPYVHAVDPQYLEHVP